VYGTEGEPLLMIEYTGSFPHVGATGGFGAEIDFDSIHPIQLEEKILDFVELAWCQITAFVTSIDQGSGCLAGSDLLIWRWRHG
jgi:hypothetical protein